MSKILNVFVFSLLLLLVACNQESIEALQLEEDSISLNVETFSLTEYEAGTENVASTRDGKQVAVVLNEQGQVIGTNPSTDLIIVCYGGPAGSPGSDCIGIHGTDDCGDVNCTENCWCYD